jgi:hypothetical protein
MKNENTSVLFTSLQDMGYKQAVTGDLLKTMANYAKANIKNLERNQTSHHRRRQSKYRLA